MTSSQALYVTRIYNFEIQIGKRTLMHLVNIIWNLHEDAILGINFIHTHQLAYCLER
jgi:predicted aspartyl protease